MKKLILCLLLLTGCASINTFDHYDEVYYQQPLPKKGEIKWSDLYVTKDSIYHRYLYIEKDEEKTLVLEITY